MVKFYMMMGLSGSGKSTFAEKIAKEENCKIISSDAIRAEFYGDESIQGNAGKVFGEVHRRISKNLRSGNSVIYDATNLNAKRRKNFLKQLDQSRIECEKILWCIITPVSECIRRRSQDGVRKVDSQIIFRQRKNFQVPWLTEGWDYIHIEYYPFEKIDVDFYLNLDVPHENKHHTLSIADHCKMAYKAACELDCSKAAQLAALYHDIGKFESKTFITPKGERVEDAHYYGHENIGAYQVMCSSLVDKWYIAYLINHHMDHYHKSAEKMSEFYSQLDAAMQKDFRILELSDVAAH